MASSELVEIQVPLPFNEKLRQVRIEKNFSKVGLARAIGREWLQIKRYEENEQFPPLDIFKRLCLVLQVDPSWFLGLEWKSKVVEGTIFKWYLSNHNSVLHWCCANCKANNVEYVEVDTKEDFHMEYMCEGCECVYNELCRDERRVGWT